MVLIVSLLLSRGALLLQIFHSKKMFFQFFLSAICICTIWISSNWAISKHMVLDACLGYFLVPLLSSFLGWLIFHEKPDAYRIIAIILGIVAVIWLGMQLSRFPWVSLFIVFSFSFYGLVRKKVTVDTLTAMVYETGILFPFALIYWIWLQYHDRNSINMFTAETYILLIGAGIVTALPLFFYATAVKRLTLASIGFLLYITPSLQFLIAVFIFHESIKIPKLIGFIIIWMALIVFSIGVVKKNRQ